MSTEEVSLTQAAKGPPASDSPTPTDTATDDVQGFLFRHRWPSRPCHCGHEMFDHLVANGGCLCRFTEAGGCTCQNFSPA